MEEIKFTTDQLKAIDHDKGPILVVAGAGTGKTAVITQRIARLILTKKAKAEEILALTFTEKAANEMQQRVDEMLPYGYLDTQIMTFHALAEKLVREYALDLGISTEFQILSDVQQNIILQEILSEADYQYYSPQHDPFDFIAAIKQSISRLKDEGITAKTFADRLKKQKAGMDPEVLGSMTDLSRIYGKYTVACEQKNGLDFGDLLLKLQHLLKSKKAIALEIQGRYKYVLVDEFQDTNTIQMDIIQNILSSEDNIMVVGDDDQAIYRFRGASINNILSFRRIFAKSKLVVLRDNFRSGQKILDAGYGLIQHNNPERLEVTEKIDKQLIAKKPVDSEVGIRMYPSKPVEADGVVENIKELVDGGVKESEIAILLRKNSQLKAYILGLQKKKLPYYVHQDVELFEQRSVKTMVSLTRSICSPLDSAALFQLLISDLYNQIDRQELVSIAALAEYRNEHLESMLVDSVDLEWSKGVIEDLQGWRGQIGELSAGELLFTAIKSTGYLKKLLNEAESSVESALAVQYLTDFFKLVKQFELVSNKPNIKELNKYLDEIKLSSGEVMSEVSPLDNSGVQLMTVHKAKGLEFDYVFLPELTEQTFPPYRQSEKIKIPDSLLEQAEGDHYQEERRLFYVALTRARRKIVMSYDTNQAGKRAKRPSRFIAEALGADWQSKVLESAQQTNMSEVISSFEPVSANSTDQMMLSRLFKGEWLYLTTNQVADYIRSPKEFWLFHVLCLPKGPFHSLVYGSAVHAALEHYYKYKLKSQPVSTGDVIKVFENAWKSEGFASKQHEEGLFNKGKQAIKNYISAHKQDQAKPVAIEKPFELQIPELKMVIKGRYDIVLETAGGVEIRDFKTSRVKTQKAADDKAKSSVQLGIYALSWEKIQQKSISSVSLEFVEDLKLGQNLRIDHSKTMDLIRKTAEGIRSKKFDEVGQSYTDFDKLIL